MAHTPQRRGVAIAILGVLFALVEPARAATFPKPQGYVSDFARTLDEQTKQDLTRTLTTLERETTAEVVVATVGSLDGLSVEDYARQLFNEWGIGKRAADNGVLLLVAPRDRRVRIQVGYGLEASLTNDLANDIVQRLILPKFRANNYAGGIRDGVDRIVAIVRTRGEVADVERAGAAPPVRDAGEGMPPELALVVMLGAGAAGFGARKMSFLPLAGGLFAAGIPLALSLTMTSPSNRNWLAGLAGLTSVLGYAVAGKYPSSTGTRYGSRSGGTDTYHSSSSDYGSSSSSSSDSFGGGSSGNSGSSGSW